MGAVVVVVEVAVGLDAAEVRQQPVVAPLVVSRRGHYSLRKAADVLGLGRESLIPVDTDDENRINTDALRDKCLELQRQKIKVMAICGVAGTTETGNVDPLDAMADIAREFGAHFHVDAAWGGWERPEAKHWFRKIL